MLDKRTLTIEELDRQTAMELPERETMLVTVVITDVLNNLSIDITVQNVDVAAQICAGVLASGQDFIDCTIEQ